jgi:DNA-binding IclR family transcriptional regulator
METTQKVLEAIKKAGKPVGAGEIVEATGLERKEVDKAMTALKKTVDIISPIRCKWEAAAK